MSDSWSIKYTLTTLLVGQVGLHRGLHDGPMSPDVAVRIIAAMPPLVDFDETEIQAQLSQRRGQPLRITVPLLAPDGPTGVSLVVDLCRSGLDNPDGTATDRLDLAGLVGFDGPAPAPIEALPAPRPDGRIPRALWVGSSSLRFDRLMQGTPVSADRWDDVDCPGQALNLLNYADGDIYNGSLDQFYSNSTGDFADRFPEWARRLGAPIKADVVAEANLLFYDIDIRDRGARNDRLDQLHELFEPGTPDDPIDRLTDRYCASTEPPFDELGVAYVNRHPADFFV